MFLIFWLTESESLKASQAVDPPMLSASTEQKQKCTEPQRPKGNGNEDQ